MVARLKSFLRAQILKLAFRAIIFSVAVWGLRYIPFGFWPTVAFLFLFGIFYFQPRLNIDVFYSSYLALAWLVFAVPVGGTTNIDILLGLWFGTIFFMLSGVKNLIFIKRELTYYIAINCLITTSIALFLYSIIDIKSQIFLATALFILFREMLATTNQPAKKVNLGAAALSLLGSEILWASLLITTNFYGAFLIGAPLLILFSDLLLNYFKQTPLKDFIIRDVSLFILFMAISMSFIYIGLPY